MQDKQPIFHQGELAIQKKLGVAEAMNTFGRKVIRDHMPLQHMAFYQNLPMLFLGFSDDAGDVWASILPSSTNFIQAPDNKTLQVKQRPLKGDPLETLLNQNRHKSEPTRVGILGLELTSRRRNRMNAEIRQVTNEGFDLSVIQTFGNCPQYIQIREMENNTDHISPSVTRIDAFDNDMQAFIQRCDTFFVASSTATKSTGTRDATDGADVSHRGGKPGFIRVDDEVTLTIPDYTGNNHFNTLGNILVNPKVGLLFVDFETGDVYSLTGSAEILWDAQETSSFKGAERLWRFKLSHGFVLKSALPWRLKLTEWSQNTLMTDTWQEAAQRQAQQDNLNRWQQWAVTKVKSESQSIKSFYLKPEGDLLPKFEAGQHLTVKRLINGKSHIRNYTVSSAPNDDFIRISVKRDGLVSTWLHQQIQAGDLLTVKSPRGQFHLEELTKPLVLLSAGVGITPMLSMLRFVINEGFRTRRTHPVYLLATFRNEKDMAFKNEVENLLSQYRHNTNVKWLVTQPQDHSSLGSDFDHIGRLSTELLQQTLPLDHYAFYLCGPDGFMQNSYNKLIKLGVRDTDIHAETFGPSKLKRLSTGVSHVSPDPKAAETALVKFSQSQVEQIWHKSEGTLLELAEAHGFTPEFSCRAGSCGSCKVKLLSGKVTHENQAQIKLKDNEALLCCAKPASVAGQDVTVTIDI